jgi:hypothetical protein
MTCSPGARVCAANRPNCPAAGCFWSAGIGVTLTCARMRRAETGRQPERTAVSGGERGRRNRPGRGARDTHLAAWRLVPHRLARPKLLAGFCRHPSVPKILRNELHLAAPKRLGRRHLGRRSAPASKSHPPHLRATNEKIRGTIFCFVHPGAVCSNCTTHRGAQRSTQGARGGREQRKDERRAHAAARLPSAAASLRRAWSGEVLEPAARAERRLMKASEGPARGDAAHTPGFSKELPLMVGNDADAAEAGSRTEYRAAAGESASRSQSERAPSAATGPDAASDQDESDSQALNGGHEPEQPAVHTPKEGALCTQCPARLLISAS